MRDWAIGAGFSLLGRTGLHRLAAPRLRGLGAILMFHHVRPYQARDFAPNRMLEITPEFLDAALGRVRALGYRVVTLEAALAEVREGATARNRAPFAVLTFDDGYRDNLLHALPVLERHEAPFTLFVTTGFADRTARLWWVDLEEAVRAASSIETLIDGRSMSLPTRTADEKRAAFSAVYWPLRAGPEDRLLATVADLARAVRVEPSALVRELCMDWQEIERVARHPLATIGAHTLTHPRLARLDAADMRTEIGASRAVLETRLGTPIRYLAYPVGDPGSAGAREFRAASEFGFEGAVTTRPGLIHAEYAAHLTALPRVSVNGSWQDLRCLEVLLSGAAFALWNRGRRLNVG